MKSKNMYCLSCGKNKRCEVKLVKKRGQQPRLSGKCPVCGHKVSKFIKQSEADKW